MAHANGQQVMIGFTTLRRKNEIFKLDNAVVHTLDLRRTDGEGIGRGAAGFVAGRDSAGLLRKHGVI